MPTTLGVIAGGGTFPHTVAQTAHARGFRVVGVGFPSDTRPDFPSQCDAFSWLKLGQLGRLIDFFRSQHVTQVVMAGPINKPRALDLRPDWRAARILFSLAAKGDDAVLRAATAELEREGMTVVGAHEFTPDLTAPAGILTHRAPSSREQEDIRLGWTLASALGSFDIGQCLVIKDGIVLAVEAIEGTDAAIARGGQLGGAGSVVIKRSKPGQDSRLDLPAVGLNTLRGMVAVGASCLAIEAGRCLFFDRAETLDFANTHDIAIVGHMDDGGTITGP